MYIGKKIKEIREAQGMKLIELADKSNVQLATLSRIENMKMVGTLDSHIKIAKALGIDVTDLYRDMVTEEQKTRLSTPRTITDYFMHNDKASQEILTSNVLSKKMMPCLLKLAPGGRTNKEQNRPGTEKFIFVLEGKIEVKAGKETYLLGPNNTLYFDATVEHWVANVGKNPARAVILATPVEL